MDEGEEEGEGTGYLYLQGKFRQAAKTNPETGAAASPLLCSRMPAE